MGSAGDCYDNALCERFFATLECELIERRRFKAQAEAKMASLQAQLTRLENYVDRIRTGERFDRLLHGAAQWTRTTPAWTSRSRDRV